MKSRPLRPKLDYADYDKLVGQRIGKILKTLENKSDEYTRNGDSLHNFNRGSEMLGQSRERYLMSLAMKHITSIMDIIDDIDNGIHHLDEVIEEKLGDAINYMILLEVSLKHKNLEIDKSFIKAKNIM